MASAARPAAAAAAAATTAATTAAGTSALMAFLAWHRHQLTTRPFLSNSIQSAVLMSAGDRIAQHLEAQNGAPPKSQRESLTRTGILTAWAACVNSPAWTQYYIWLARRFPGRVYLWVAMNVAVSPLWNSAFFSYCVSATHLLMTADPLSREGRAALRAKVRHKLETSLWPTVQRSTALWVPVNLVNFSLVPLHYRMMTGGIVALFWNVYLSWTAAQSGAGHAAQAQPAAAQADAAAAAAAGAAGASSAEEGTGRQAATLSGGGIPLPLDALAALRAFLTTGSSGGLGGGDTYEAANLAGYQPRQQEEEEEEDVAEAWSSANGFDDWCARVGQRPNAAGSSASDGGGCTATSYSEAA